MTVTLNHIALSHCRLPPKGRSASLPAPCPAHSPVAAQGIWCLDSQLGQVVHLADKIILGFYYFFKMWDEFSGRQTFAKCPVSEVDSQFSGLLFITSILSKNFSWAKLSKCYMQSSQGFKHKGLQGSSCSQLLASSPMPTLRLLYSRALMKMKFRPTASCLEDLPCTFPVGMFMLHSTALYSGTCKSLE